MARGVFSDATGGSLQSFASSAFTEFAVIAGTLRGGPISLTTNRNLWAPVARARDKTTGAGSGCPATYIPFVRGPQATIVFKSDGDEWTFMK